MDLIGDCVFGYIEKNVMFLHSIPHNSGEILMFPCIVNDNIEHVEYIGLGKTLRAEINGGTIESEARKCTSELRGLCEVVIGYCGVMQGHPNACDLVETSPEAYSLCREVFDILTVVQYVTQDQNK